MKATIEIELQPFTVPNFVRPTARQMAGDEQVKEIAQESFPLSALDPVTLDKMCDEFRDGVFKKAGKNPPPTVRPA